MFCIVISLCLSGKFECYFYKCILTTLIALGKTTWGWLVCVLCCQDVDWGKVILSFRLHIPDPGSCVPILDVWLNTLKAVKHTGVLCHEKSFANFR